MHRNSAAASGEVLVAAVIVCALAANAVGRDLRFTQFVPFFPAATDTGPEGVLRIVNTSDDAGTLSIIAVDDAGRSQAEHRLTIGANETLHLDAGDLETGDGAPGEGTGPPQGDWRLHLTSSVDIEPRAYARTPDGALAEMHETASDQDHRYPVVTFNPGSNHNQASRLRLLNPGAKTAEVSIQGTDDAGASPGPGVALQIPAATSISITAADLESGGAPGLTGSLGDGEGKWRLTVESSHPIRVMSLLSSPTGHLTNLSTIPAHKSGDMHRVPLFPPASDSLDRQGFARIVNHSDAPGEVHIQAYDDTAWTYEPLGLSIGARQTVQFNSSDLELGNADKGLSGGTGAGEGDWRLELRSDLDLEVLSYIRTTGGQGYVTPMHDTAAQEVDGLMRYYVPIFHPSGYEGQESRLHLVNLGSGDAEVRISGLDDGGRSPPEGDVSLMLEPGETRVLTAQQLEEGADGLDGRLGTGSGRWRLFVTTDGELQVMSLGYSADGFLANLSRGRLSGPGPAYHGAVAIDAKSTPTGCEFYWGFSVDRESQPEAEELASKACSDKGGGGQLPAKQLISYLRRRGLRVRGRHGTLPHYHVE